jgi:hypothetical protein
LVYECVRRGDWRRTGFVSKSDIGIPIMGPILFILAFLIVFTIIGLLINLRWVQALEHLQDNIEKTTSLLGIKANFVVPASGIRTKWVFVSFYVIMLIGLIIGLIGLLVFGKITAVGC